MVNENSRPRVLIVDDDDMEGFAALLDAAGLLALHVTPDELSEDHLSDVHIVLIDEYLEEWHRRESVSDAVGLYVRDGIALSAVLRSHLDNRGPAEHVPLKPRDTSIVLRTGRLDVLAAGTPRYMRPVTVSRQHDLEWVLRKEDENGEREVDVIKSLASAVLNLPQSWNGLTTEDIYEWLGLGSQSWRDAASQQIEECRPPWSVLAASSAGRKWISWFLQRILPFPTFLIDDLRAAAYLGLSYTALDVLVKDDGVVGNMLRASQYTGELKEFTGRRWWRAGLQHLKAEMLGSSSDRSADSIIKSVEVSCGLDLSLYRLGIRFPVFEIDNDYNVRSKPIEIETAVRLQPDEWPSYADDPWLDARVAQSDELSKLVIVDDRSFV